MLNAAISSAHQYAARRELRQWGDLAFVRRIEHEDTCGRALGNPFRVVLTAGQAHLTISKAKYEGLGRNGHVRAHSVCPPSSIPGHLLPRWMAGLPRSRPFSRVKCVGRLLKFAHRVEDVYGWSLGPPDWKELYLGTQATDGGLAW